MLAGILFAGLPAFGQERPWLEVGTEHFVLYTDTDVEKAERLAELEEERLRLYRGVESMCDVGEKNDVDQDDNFKQVLDTATDLVNRSRIDHPTRLKNAQVFQLRRALYALLNPKLYLLTKVILTY